MRELAAAGDRAAGPGSSRYWSDLDQVMFPQRTAALDHPDLDVTNVRLHGVGHTQHPHHGRPSSTGISEALAHLDADGRTVAAGPPRGRPAPRPAVDGTPPDALRALPRRSVWAGRWSHRDRLGGMPPP